MSAYPAIATEFLERALGTKQSEKLTAEYFAQQTTTQQASEAHDHDSSPTCTATATPVVIDPRDEARKQRRRTELAKARAALKRWLSRLKWATNTVTDLHQRIGRLESALTPD